MFFERKYTACLTDMPRQRIPQTHKATRKGQSFFTLVNLSNVPVLEDRKLCEDRTSSK